MVRLTVFNSIDEAALKVLDQGLMENAKEKNALPYHKSPLSVLAHDESGALIGGLTGETFWSWLYIDILWVSKEYRGRGLGGDLVKRAEMLALERGCHSSHLWTESFEGPDFYPKFGYQKFVVQEDCPPGHHRIGFMKRLAA